MKIYEILNETPITYLGKINPEEKNGAFKNPNDSKLIKSKDYSAKMLKFFEKTPFNFRLFFVNVTSFGDYAIIDHDNPREISIETLNNLLEPYSDDIKQDMIKMFTDNANNAITILYAGNAETIDGKIANNVQPITPWIAAHRIGHALDDFKSSTLNMFNFTNKLQQAIHNLIERMYTVEYDIDEFEFDDQDKDPYLQVAHAIGTQRSSRNNMLSDNVHEFPNELLAQYLNTGTVTLNPFPKYIIYDGLQYHGNGTEKNMAYGLSKWIVACFEKILNSAMGKIFII